MHRIKQGSKTPFLVRLIGKINKFLFNTNLLFTFLGILPTILFIYYNLIYFNAVKTLVGCATLLTLVKVNKSIQG